MARHRHAGIYLFGLSFLESFILPISPAVLQIPMTIARPRKAWRYVLYAFVGSCLGGIVGYLIGDFIIRLIFSYFQDSSYYAQYLSVKAWVQTYGVWILFPVSLSPIPYKITTIASGLLGIPFWLFFVVTIPARLIHFSVIAYLMSHQKMTRLKRYMMHHYGKQKAKQRQKRG